VCLRLCVFVRMVAARQQPAPLRPARPAGFTNEPTKEISRASVAAALAGAKGGAAATDENVAPSATPASGGVVRPTPKVAVPSASASSNTPKPPLSSLTRPTAASAAKSSSKAAATPRGAASSSKAAPAPVDSCSKCTPKSAGAKTATRTSLGGRTPTVTMTCRCEALDMMDKEGETLEASFNDGDVSLNASQEKSSEVDSSQSSAAASSSGSEGNQFGSPAAVGVPQATTTLVFSATKLVPDLTGTSVLAARSPKLRTPPQTTGKIKVRAVGWNLSCCVVCVCVCARGRAWECGLKRCGSIKAPARLEPDLGARLHCVAFLRYGRVFSRRPTR
jgi:hypothetical protein